MDVILACAYGLRSNVACSIPGSLMLSVQLARPVTRAGSSLRGTPPPTYFCGASVKAAPFLGRRGRGRRAGVPLHELDGLDDVLVAGAATEVALQPLPDLRLRGVGLLPEQAYGGHDHAGRAITALQPVRLVEGLLHRMPEAVLPDTLHRRDLGPVGLHREDRTRLDRLAVYVDGARAATRGVATRMHAPDPEVLPEMVEQEQPGLHLRHVRAAVDRHLDPPQP